MQAGQKTALAGQATAERILANLQQVILGKEPELRLALIALACQGHMLIEDVPGVGKTMLAKAIARSIGCTYSRVQFTPDLLPSDITGVSVFNQKNQEFEFRPGPVMAQIVLADEINRAPPKSQAALLECMAEGQITVDGTRHAMPYPFMVMATQNPIEYEGTYPLPETELDRFLLRLNLGYPAADDEIKMLQSQQLSHPIDSLEQVVTQDELVELQHSVREVQVSPLVAEYIVSLAAATRDHAQLYLGASPRGSLGVFRMAQARALLDGRDFALPDDVKASIEPALAHRMVLDPAAQSRGATMATVIADILETVAVPGTLSS